MFQTKHVPFEGSVIKEAINTDIRAPQKTEAQCLHLIEGLLKGNSRALSASDIYEVMKTAATKSYWGLVDFFLKQPAILSHVEMLPKSHDVAPLVKVFKLALADKQWEMAYNVWLYCKTSSNLEEPSLGLGSDWRP